MDSILRKISLKMFELNMIEASDLDLIQYGLELFLLKIVHFGGIFLLAFLMKGLYGVGTMIIFSIPFLSLRSNSGGYHAKTRLRCFIISLLITVLVLFITPLLESVSLKVLVLICSLFIYNNSPLIHKNNPLYPEESMILHERVKVILLAIFISAGILEFLKFESVLNIIYIAIILVSLFMVIEILIK